RRGDAELIDGRDRGPLRVADLLEPLVGQEGGGRALLALLRGERGERDGREQGQEPDGDDGQGHQHLGQCHGAVPSPGGPQGTAATFTRPDSATDTVSVALVWVLVTVYVAAGSAEPT